MPRLVAPSIPRTLQTTPARFFVASRRCFAETPENDKGAQNSRPSWPGRHGDDHVLNRDALDAQSKPSHQARQDKEQGNEGSSAISQKDEKNSNQRAKEENPEAPGPVIGMNSERGSKGG